jgi:hypothetical protein
MASERSARLIARLPLTKAGRALNLEAARLFLMRTP